MNTNNMRKFITKVIAFCLIFLLSLIPLEICLRNYLFINDTILKSATDQFESKSNQINSLFIGNSKVYYAITASDCFTKNNFYNFSFPSETIESTYWKLKYYFDHDNLKNIKQVFIQLERGEVYSGISVERNNMYDYSKYYKHSFEDITINQSFVFKLNEWLTNNFIFYRLRPYLIDLILNQINYKIIKKGINTNKTDFFGAGALYTKYNADQLKKDIPSLLIQESQFENAQLNATQIAYYDKIVQLLEKKGIKVDFIKIIEPIDIAAQNNTSVKDILIKNFKKDENLIHTRYRNSKLIEFNNYSNLFELEDFADKLHLNNKGSEKFSRLLSATICN